MPFAATLSTAAETARALDEICASIGPALQGAPDLALLFFSPHHREAAQALAEGVRQRLAPRCLIGCSGEAIIGNEREVWDEPAVSLWAGQWDPPVTPESFHLVVEATSDGYSLLGWPDSLMEGDHASSTLLLLGDPFSFPADHFLKQINEQCPGLRVAGGMASGGSTPGQCALLRDGNVLDTGAVGVLLRPPVHVRSLVSQGCRPIGRPLVVTRATDNLILELGGKPPLAQLEELWNGLSPEDRVLFQQGLHLGRVISEYREEFQRGDFLVRNVVGLDRSTGALVITDRVRVGQTVQFHVRDGASADEDLRALLQIDHSAAERPAQGALLFSCNGRGVRMFDTPDHDTRVLREESGPIPVAGFFAMGELGPVGGQNFIHGFTASMVLFD